MPEFITAATEEDYREARALLREYEVEIEVDLCFQGFEEELETLERVYGSPGGRFLLLRQGERTAGCVALRDLGGGICEMKRLFLRPGFRGKGLGRKCAEQIVRTAREMGYRAMRLDTLSVMQAAIALYRSMGFTEIAPYTEIPWKARCSWSWSWGRGRVQTETLPTEDRMSPTQDSFTLPEATIDDIHAAYAAGGLTARQLVQMYIDRIEAYDRGGPRINSIITVNPAALEEADRLDAAFKSSGKAGPLHGIPVLIKDQADLKGTPTTLGSLVFKDYYPDRDCRVVEKLKEAGAIVLAKTTLGELGAGDTHGSLFGSTRNPYDVERTVGGSSGGSGAAVSANFGTVGIGQEGLASIRRPSTWNCIAGMRPTAGLVSRSGVYSGWPQEAGSLGPMARTVRDMATLLDVMVGYDGDDPITSRGVGHAPSSYTDFLDADGLRGARIGILRTPMGYNTDPEADDFKSITGVLDNAVEELRAAGAEVVDPVELARLNELLAKRCANPTAGETAFGIYMARSANPPYRTREEAMQSPEFAKLSERVQVRLKATADPADHYQYLLARDHLMIHLLKTMAEHRLDAIVHKAVEHQPTLIADGVKPPYVNHKGAPHLNTFLVYVPTVTVPAGFTTDGLPAGISFLGRPYDDGRMIRLAYAYEQATHHRRAPESAP